MKDVPKVIHRDELRAQTTQTPGMLRHEAHATDRMWMGKAETKPRYVSGWHHHGAYESAIYVVEGRIRVEGGPGGTLFMEAGPGDFIWVPAGVIHRESNPGDAEQEIVLVRAGEGEVVVNVEDPEPE